MEHRLEIVHWSHEGKAWLIECSGGHRFYVPVPPAQVIECPECKERRNWMDAKMQYDRRAKP